MRANPRDFEPDSPQSLGADNIQSLAVLIAECQVGEPHSFRSGYLSQALSGGRNNPHAPHPRGINVPQDVHLHPIGAAGAFFAGEINKEPFIFDRVV
jgi:hypothetical protein